MSSQAPEGLPSHSNGGLIATGVLLLLAAGGLVVWKSQSKGSEVATETATVQAPAAPEKLALDNAPPPPPPEEAPVEQVVAPSGKPSPGGVKPTGPAGCLDTCAGNATPALQSALFARGGTARSCYMTALRNNPTLEGKMTMRVKISPTGAVCSAGVTSNSLGDQAVASCAAAKFRGANFPPPKGGCVDANIPLNFTSKQ